MAPYRTLGISSAGSLQQYEHKPNSRQPLLSIGPAITLPSRDTHRHISRRAATTEDGQRNFFEGRRGASLNFSVSSQQIKMKKTNNERIISLLHLLNEKMEFILSNETKCSKCILLITGTGWGESDKTIMTHIIYNVNSFNSGMPYDQVR